MPQSSAEKVRRWRAKQAHLGLKEIRGMYATPAEKIELRKKFDQIKSRRK